MMESGYFNNGNFREYSYFAGGGLCSLETGITGGPEKQTHKIFKNTSSLSNTLIEQFPYCVAAHNRTETLRLSIAIQKL